jgi:hypothetical protein
VQDLVAQIHTLLDLHDYKAADTHLNHLAGAYRLREHVKSGIEIENSFKVIREVINTRTAFAESDIEITESYVLVRQKLDLVKSISAHLASHLNDANKVLAVKLEYLLQERVKKQYTAIMAQINSLTREGNVFVEAKDKYLTELLANNLSVMAEVDKLFEGCTHYHTSTEALNKILAFHHTRFLAELSKQPTPPELQLSFKVLKSVSQSQSLLAHSSTESQLLFGRVEKALLQLYVFSPSSTSCKILANII